MSDEQNGGGESSSGSGGSNSGSNQVPNPFEFLDLQTESYNPQNDEALNILNEKKERR